MWSFLPYWMEAQVCFVLLWLCYRMIFSRDKAFGCNRAYLLLSVPVAFCIPLLSFPVLPGEVVSEWNEATVFDAGQASVSVEVIETVPTAMIGWQTVLPLVALGGSVVMLLSLAINAVRLYGLTRGAVTRSAGGFYISYTTRADSAFSLFNHIYINERDISREDIPQVITHEMCHVRLLHSWDMVLATLVRIAFWWNPVVWLWYRSLREVHEYQADDAVLRGGYDSERYITLMLRQLTWDAPDLVSGFSYSLVRKRLLMISRSRPMRLAVVKPLVWLPPIGLLLLLFSFTERLPELPAVSGERELRGGLFVTDRLSLGTNDSDTVTVLRKGASDPTDGSVVTASPSVDIVREEPEPGVRADVAAESRPMDSVGVVEEAVVREPVVGNSLAALARNIRLKREKIRSDFKYYLRKNTAFRIDDLENYRIYLDGKTLNPEEFAELDSLTIDTLRIDNVNRRITAVSGTSHRQVRIHIDPVPEDGRASVEPKESYRSVVQRYNRELRTRDTLAVIHAVVDQLPRFQGAGPYEARFGEWVTRQLKDPSFASDGKNGKKDFINVVYTVKANGTIADVKVLSGPDNALTEAALSVIHSSPRWSPAINNGVPVDVTLMSRIVL